MWRWFRQDRGKPKRFQTRAAVWFVFALWGVSNLFRPLPLPAADEGGIRPEIGFYYQRFQTQGLGFSSREFYSAVAFYQYLTNYGLL